MPIKLDKIQLHTSQGILTQVLNQANNTVLFSNRNSQASLRKSAAELHNGCCL